MENLDVTNRLKYHGWHDIH